MKRGGKGTDVIGSERIIWVDIFKGLCIIFMVVGHTSSPFTTLIYLFLIPAFFIISGYTYNEKKYSMGRYIWEKTKNLLFPFFIVNIFFILLYRAILALGYSYLFVQGTEPGLFARLDILFSVRLGRSDLGEATWFLIVLFLAEVLYRFLGFVCDKIPFLRQKEWILAFCAGIAGYLLGKMGIGLPFDIDLALIACMYLGIGVALRRYNIIEEYIPQKTMLLASLCVVGFFGLFFYRGLIPMNWPLRNFNPLLIQIVTVFCSVYLLVVISHQLETNSWTRRMLSLCGQRSFAILVFHFIAFRLFSLCLVLLGLQPRDRLQQLVPPSTDGLLWMAYAVFSLAFCLLLSHLASKFTVANYFVNARLARRSKKKEKA